MTLRDLFDADPRSKEDLRSELQAALESRETAAISLRAAEQRLHEVEQELRRSKGDLEVETAAHAETRSVVAAALAQLEIERASVVQRQAALGPKERAIAQGELQIQRFLVAAAIRHAALQRGALEQRAREGRLDAQAAEISGERDRLADRQRQLDVQSASLAAAHSALEANKQRFFDEVAQLRPRTEGLARGQAALLAGQGHLEREKTAFELKLNDLRRREQRIDEKLEVISRAGLLEKREADVKRREHALELGEKEARQTEEDLRSARAEVVRLGGEIKERDRRVRSLETKLQRAQETLESTIGRASKAEGLAKDRARVIRELKATLSRPFLLRVGDDATLRWLAGLHAVDAMAAVGREPVTVGHGPWGEEQFDSVLQECGMVPQLLDQHAADFHVFVVGEEGVDIEALAGAIETRLDQGGNVYLYSQELWLLYLMTGHDPMELPVDFLREVFGAGHQVLSAFINEEWDWPEFGVAQAADTPGAYELLERGASPLHEFGYRAGKGTHESERRAKLKDFMACRNLAPYFDAAQHDLAYRNSWGRAGSSMRFKRVVSHIRWLYAFQGASPSKSTARENWQDDLQWLQMLSSRELVASRKN
jgi:hypothetical protein